MRPVAPLARRSFAALPFVLAANASSLVAQNASTTGAPKFSARDALDVVTYSVGDLSPDGRWLATLWDPLESTCRHASLSIL